MRASHSYKSRFHLDEEAHKLKARALSSSNVFSSKYTPARLRRNLHICKEMLEFKFGYLYLHANRHEKTVNAEFAADYVFKANMAV